MEKPPRFRSECYEGPRPCRAWNCRYHLNPGTYHEVQDGNRWIPCDANSEKGQWESVANGLDYQRNYDLFTSVSRVRATCALDVAEEGEIVDFGDIAEYLHMSRERTRQVAYKALDKAEVAARLLGLDEEDLRK